MSYARIGAKRRRLNGAVHSRRTNRVLRRSTRSFYRRKRPYYRPFKKFYKKRVAVRHPTPAAIPSPFKVQKELALANMWTGPSSAGTFERGSRPTTDGQWASAFLLSPIKTAESFGDRKVEGDRARLVSANVQYIFANKMATNLTVRVTVVELKSELQAFAGTTQNWNQSTFLYRMFKNENPNSRVIDFMGWLEASGRERDFYAMNTPQYKILGQKIIKLGAHGTNASDWTARPSVQGCHMYVKMNRLLDKNDEVTSQEQNNRNAYLTTPVYDTFTRYAYYKPILVLVDVLPEVGRSLSTETKCLEMERNVKYTWRDAA